MSGLTRYGRKAPSVFDLLGRGEEDLTAALGWTLAQSPTLTAALWQRLGMPGDPCDVSVALEVAGAEGRTDLELVGTNGDHRGEEGLAVDGRASTEQVPRAL